MNKELAINLLRGSILGTNEQLHEAVFMAIKALKAEPKTGHWIEKIIYSHSYAECSECKTIYSWSETETMRYCKRCGARMGGGENDWIYR